MRSSHRVSWRQETNGSKRGNLGFGWRRDVVKDPVCGMMIDEKTAAGKSEYQGQTYYFCVAICKTKFDQDPGRYLGKDR
jgi:Cu+-exporting ATPase